MKQTRRPTRREKLVQEKLEAKVVSKIPSARRDIPKLEAKNQNQRTALSILMNGTPIVFLTGSAGTGKSMLAAYRIAKLLSSKEVDKVYLVRPAVGVGKSIGLLPGEIEDKMAPYFAQTIAHLESFLEKGFVQYALEKKIIEMKPAEYMRGMSFERCAVLVEECQGFTYAEFQMMLTRLGEDCQMIFTGDQRQSDLGTASGLTKTIDLVNRMLQTHPEYLDHDDIDALDSSVGVVQFMPEDVVRSGFTRAMVKVYYYE